MKEIDKRHKLDEEVFSYRATKDGKVFLYWHQKQIKILKGLAAQAFLEEVSDADPKEAQLIMARITGNFKHGNERSS
ncbi:MAG: hypothetical protein H0W02_13415 [Ktedonobacteraceae bacterium]|nr:hypothetical protein [Ktedonobacteraceae bacterium]